MDYISVLIAKRVYGSAHPRREMKRKNVKDEYVMGIESKAASIHTGRAAQMSLGMKFQSNRKFIPLRFSEGLEGKPDPEP